MDQNIMQKQVVKNNNGWIIRCSLKRLFLWKWAGKFYYQTQITNFRQMFNVQQYIQSRKSSFQDSVI